MHFLPLRSFIFLFDFIALEIIVACTTYRKLSIKPRGLIYQNHYGSVLNLQIHKYIL